MIKLLRQPYPYDDELVNKLEAAAVSGVLVVAFLWIFKPFDIANTPVANLSLFIVGYGLVTALVVVLVLIGLPVLFKRYFIEETWTVGKNIVFFLLIVFLIGTANLYYTHAIAGLPLSLPAFLSFQFYTLTVGLVVAFTTTFIKYTLKLQQHQREVVAVNNELEKHKAEIIESHQTVNSNSFTLQSENGKEELMLTTETFLYIESAENYSNVFFLEASQPKQILLRSSLKRIEESLLEPSAFRCHRSFIVNLRMVESMSGNSQGYKLNLRHVTQSIPVARRLNETIATRLKTI